TGTATQFDATVNGPPVSIYVPVQSPARGYGIPGEKEIVRALETVPPQQYKDLETVSLNASPNPRDALWQEEYGDSSFSSAATADIEQGVAFFPWKGWSTFPQRYVDSTMLHETGHLERSFMERSGKQTGLAGCYCERWAGTIGIRAKQHD
ncbi:hypothetical protein, partial [Caballeronia sp.]|uniref:hypothetical protein n=1 Tax=Caballeronia sp. TaxID=1931223 RepID=UPI002638EB85